MIGAWLQLQVISKSDEENIGGADHLRPDLVTVLSNFSHHPAETP